MAERLAITHYVASGMGVSRNGVTVDASVGEKKML
jgi:hypothetical protein